MNKYLCTQCSHPFSHPLVLTNKSEENLETYYACPYCLTKVEVDDGDLIEAFREERKTTGFMRDPATNQECPEETVRRNIVIPDDCLDCANLLPCVHTLITLIESRSGSPERHSVCKFLNRAIS